MKRPKEVRNRIIIALFKKILHEKKYIIIKLIIFMTASILASFKVEEKHCLELITANIRSNDGIISYPSTLGQDCNTRTKLQLVLFLVRIMCIKIINLKPKKKQENYVLMLLFHILFSRQQCI